MFETAPQRLLRWKFSSRYLNLKISAMNARYCKFLDQVSFYTFFIRVQVEEKHVAELKTKKMAESLKNERLKYNQHYPTSNEGPSSPPFCNNHCCNFIQNTLRKKVIHFSLLSLQSSFSAVQKYEIKIAHCFLCIIKTME